MKTLIKHISLLAIPAFIVGAILISCEKKDEGGTPSISYIRTTGNADSTITSAAKGKLIAIIGENLGGAIEIWFNDQEANLTPTYVTDKSILVSVPKVDPLEENNKLTIKFNDGYILYYDFSLDPSGPEIYSIKCEYVPAGGTAYLTGEFFYEPTTVIFPGDVEGTVTSLTQTSLAVTVPEGAQPGKIKVRTNFGIVSSPFLFRDTTNVILDFDSLLHTTWTWTAPIVYADSLPDPAPCSGNYVTIISDEVSGWDWENSLSIQHLAEDIGRDVPLATGLVNELIFRFEVNVPIEWYNVKMEIYMTIYGNGHGRDSNPRPSHARWMPWLEGPYTTDGWITMSIPLSEFTFDKGDPETDEIGSNPISDLSILTNLTMMVFGANDSGEYYPVKICIDNVRIVPK